MGAGVGETRERERVPGMEVSVAGGGPIRGPQTRCPVPSFPVHRGCRPARLRKADRASRRRRGLAPGAAGLLPGRGPAGARRAGSIVRLVAGYGHLVHAFFWWCHGTDLSTSTRVGSGVAVSLLFVRLTGLFLPASRAIQF